MIIYLGADHRGFKMKEVVKTLLHDRGYEVIDLGNATYQADDDYPDFAGLVARKVSLEYAQSRGVLVCGSGVGMSVVANRFPNVRAALVLTPDQAYDARHEDDANILVLPSEHMDAEKVKAVVATFFETPFSAEPRYLRRIKKLAELENDLMTH